MYIYITHVRPHSSGAARSRARGFKNENVCTDRRARLFVRDCANEIFLRKLREKLQSRFVERFDWRTWGVSLFISSKTGYIPGWRSIATWNDLLIVTLAGIFVRMTSAIPVLTPVPSLRWDLREGLNPAIISSPVTGQFVENTRFPGFSRWIICFTYLTEGFDVNKKRKIQDERKIWYWKLTYRKINRILKNKEKNKEKNRGRKTKIESNSHNGKKDVRFSRQWTTMWREKVNFIKI